MRQWIPAAVLLAIVAAMLVNGPIAQLPRYHEFADHRAWLGIPNGGDVFSNLPFALVALWGFRYARTPGYFVFLLGVLLTAIGSSYYHLAPDDSRLVWDRLPISIACAGILAAVHAETHASTPRWLLAALVAFAIVGVWWWTATADLRPYLLLQVSLVLIPIWQWLAGSPRSDRIAIVVAIACYALAKVFELRDRDVLDALGFVSGHSIKHLLAAAGGAAIVANLTLRASSSRART